MRKLSKVNVYNRVLARAKAMNDHPAGRKRLSTNNVKVVKP